MLSETLMAINKFLGDWQYIWFFVILAAGLGFEIHSNYVLRKEFEYDEQKDLEKKHRRTKTTKKTTKGIAGEETTEETTETSEPMAFDNVERGVVGNKRERQDSGGTPS